MTHLTGHGLCRGVRAVRWGPLLGVLLAALCLGCPSAAGAAEKISYQDTAEWGRLVRLWQTLLDHSSGAIYSAERFKDLASALECADADLDSLAGKKLLAREQVDGLRRTFHSRYGYVKDQCYGAGRARRLDALESAGSASQWITEMQLDLLRQSSKAGTLDRKLSDAIRTNLVTECTFQRSLEVVQADLAARQQALKPEEQGPDSAARARFEQDSRQRRRRLLEAYEDRRLPRDREIERLVPYLMELTKAQPR